MPVRLGDKHTCEVGVERQTVYPHRCGSVQTPLPRPVTIPEMVVELGCVIGVHITGGQDIDIRIVNNATLGVETLKQRAIGWNTLLPEYEQYHITISYICKL